MASVTHLGVVVKYYGGISNFWRERLAYLKNVGIKYLFKKKDTYQINTDVSEKGKLKIRQQKDEENKIESRERGKERRQRHPM